MNILFVACYSHFINNSASIRTLYYLNYLVNMDGNSVTLLTVNFPKDSIYYDEYIFNMLDTKVKVHSISGGILFNKAMPRKNVKNDKEKVSVMELHDFVEKQNKITFKQKAIKFMKKMKSTFISPDMYYKWSKKAGKYCINLMNNQKNNNERFDVIFSMHEPPSSHLCAYNIKNTFKDIPWVQYYSDPWVRDPNRSSMPKIRRSHEQKLERKVVSLGDKFVFVSTGNRDEFISEYGISKEDTYLVQRGFDIKKYDEILKCKAPINLDKNKINMVHTGEIFTKLRDVKPFIKALSLLEKQDNKLYNELNIMFYGNIDDKNIKKQLQEVSIIKVQERIPYKDALEYMIHSQVLLLFSNKNSNQIPGKIYDYFGTRNNIFVILGDEKDPIIPIVKDNKKCTTTENNCEDILKSLYEIIEKVKENQYSPPIMEFEWANVVKKLNDILKESL